MHEYLVENKRHVTRAGEKQLPSVAWKEYLTVSLFQ